LVIDTRKSVSSVQAIPSAAIEALSSDGATKLPEAFLRAAKGRPLAMAYPIST
jgi:hypothetical protein